MRNASIQQSTLCLGFLIYQFIVTAVLQLEEDLMKTSLFSYLNT